MPMRWTAAEASVRDRRMIEGIARLRSGVSLAHGTEELKARFAQLAVAYPAANGRSTVAVRGLADIMLGSLGPNASLLPLLAGVSALMLGIAYLNLGTLAVGRREARRHELALRHALGAGRWRQRAARWIEAATIAGLGGAAGVLLAAWTIPIVMTRYGSAIARAETIRFDASSLMISLAATLGAVVVMALSMRGGSSVVLAAARRPVSSGTRLQHRLVAAQVGLACGLVYGALLVGGMIASLARVDLGVPLANALTFSVGVPTARYDSPERVRDFFAGLERDLRSLPGVLAVGATSRTPFAGGTNGEVSNADDPSRSVPIAEMRVVTPEFFQAIGLSFRHGAGFSPAAVNDADRVVISEALSVALFGSPDGTGRRIRSGKDAPAVVAGVVRDLRDFGPAQPMRPTIYFRHGSRPGFASGADLRLILRTAGSSMVPIDAVRQRLAALDPNVPLRSIATLSELAERSFGTNRTTAGTVLATFAAAATTLGMIGVFGVVAVSVERRTREIGVRLALGGSPERIVRMFLAEGLRLTGVGLVVGAGVSWLVHRLVGGFLIAAHQPRIVTTVALVLALLVVASVVACLLPARRAAGISPTDALKAE
jgi:predicted permease